MNTMMYHNTQDDEEDIDASTGYQTSVIGIHDIRHAALTWIDEQRQARGSPDNEQNGLSQDDQQPTPPANRSTPLE